MPLDAKIIAFPVAYACTAMLALTAKTLALDPEGGKTGMQFYEDDGGKAAEGWSDVYYWTVWKKFQSRVQGHQSWSVPLWTNEFKAEK